MAASITGAIVTEREQRRVIYSYCCRPFLRQQENYFWGLPGDPAHRARGLPAAARLFDLERARAHPRSGRQGLLAPQDKPIGSLDMTGRPLADL
jgi:hypothetical protein